MSNSPRVRARQAAPIENHAEILRELRRCPVRGHRLGKKRVALTVEMSTALFHKFVGWQPAPAPAPHDDGMARAS